MIFINNAKKKIGNEGLIIKLKANNFFEGQGLRPDDFHKLYEIYSKYYSKITLPEAIRQNFYLCIQYYEYDYNDEVKSFLDENAVFNIYNIIHGDWTREEKLFIIFNIIEIEIKIRKKSKKELIELFNILEKINCDKNKKETVDYYYLQQHYFAYLKILIGDYDFSDNVITELIKSMDSNNNQDKSNLFEYLRIRNSILKIKILELKDPDKNSKEIIAHLDNLFTTIKNTKEDFAICIGIKNLSLQSKEIVSFEDCIKLIQEMLDVLKRETLFGKSHKNILEQYLYLSGLLGYFNSINDDVEGIKKATKKIDKYLLDVKDIIEENKKNNKSEILNSKGENIPYDNLYNSYSYFNSMLKLSMNINDINEIKTSIETKNKIETKSDFDLFNFCVLEKEDLTMSSKFQKLEETFDKWIGQNLEIKNDKIILVYFYLYNKISKTTKEIVDKINLDSNNINIKQIEYARNFATKIIDMTKKQVVERQNDFLKKIFKLPVFKNLFSKIYYVKVYSYYLEGKYKECLDEYYQYNKYIKEQYELETPKSEEYMKKIEADCYFKLKEYEKAEEIYDKIIGMGSKDPLIYFNLGLATCFLNKKQKAISVLKNAVDIYRKENNAQKEEIVGNLINKLEEGK